MGVSAQGVRVTTHLLLGSEPVRSQICGCPAHSQTTQASVKPQANRYVPITSLKWTVHVLKTDKRKRTAVFSESSSTPSGALEALHQKSAMAVNQFITTNGFDLPLKFSSCSAGRKASRGPYRTSLDESEIISLDGESGTSSSDESDDASSDSDTSRSVSSVGKGAQRDVTRITPRPHMAVRRSEPYGNDPPYRATYEHPFNAVGRLPHESFLPPVGPGLLRPARIRKHPLQRTCKPSRRPQAEFRIPCAARLLTAMEFRRHLPGTMGFSCLYLGSAMAR
jgi:hypothetical protein